MTKTKFVNEETVENVAQWFHQFGETDDGYMRAHWERFLNTREFALSAISEGESLTILDMGAHWLHNAFLYSNLGHKVICVDAPDTLLLPQVKSIAEVMSADLVPTKRMEKGDGIADLPESSFDLVLFCEIIEHLAFNPISFWKHIYRILKPGGRIIITTPNAFYYRTLVERLNRIINGACFGLSVDEIFGSGTYGHHWKEFTIAELQAYFSKLSPDFDSSRYKMIYHPGDQHAEIIGSFERAVAEKVDIRAFNIYLDVRLSSKEHGIVINPPWETM